MSLTMLEPLRKESGGLPIKLHYMHGTHLIISGKKALKHRLRL